LQTRGTPVGDTSCYVIAQYWPGLFTAAQPLNQLKSRVETDFAGHRTPSVDAEVDSEKGLLAWHDDLTDYQNSTAPKVRRVTTYMTQPDYPNPEFTSSPTSSPASPPSASKTLDLNDGTYVVFLDMWQRDVTALDDPLIREVALGGPDTMTRVKNAWQVRLLPMSTGATSPPTSPPSGDGRRGGDFEMWFWLVPSPGLILDVSATTTSVFGSVRDSSGNAIAGARGHLDPWDCQSEYADR
jgi:hypothetical protein